MHHYYIIFKPYGYLSQFVYNLKRNKKLLGELYNFAAGTMAIGRLDEDSEGLLLLTTDGMMSEIIRSKSTEKEYFVQVDGLITKEALEKIQIGVEIGFKGIRYTTLPCLAHTIDAPDIPLRGKKIRDGRHGPTSWISVTVTEGKFRQVRKMTAAAGFPTLRLIRVRIGAITLGSMKPGDVIETPSLEV